MFLFQHKPLFAPETEAGVDGGQEAPPTPPNERPVDGPGSGRGELRKQLEKSVEVERKARTEREKTTKEPSKKPAKARAPNHQDTETEVEEPEEVIDEGTEAPESEETEKEAQVEAAPEGFNKEAKAEWAKTPAQVRAAILKREADMAKGVTEIKQKYADIDQVLAPRLDVIRKHGHTPAQAVNQLFAWFDALAANPKQAFPALAQSFKYDLRELVPGAAPEVEETEKEQTPEWKAELEAMKQAVQQQLGSFSQQFQQQSMVKTQEVLDTWARGKPHFEEARQMMAHLIGSGAVPPLPNGSADLDKAYDMAVYAIPELRARVLQEQSAAKAKEAADKKAAEKRAQQEAADKARRAGTSVRGGAPGEPPAPGKGKGKGKSVRESIMEAREELSGD